MPPVGSTETRETRVEDAWSRSVECSDHIACIALSRDELRVCLGSAGGEIVVVEVETGRVAGRLEGHAGGTLCLCFSPDGRLVSSGEDSFVRVHSLETFSEIGRMRIESTDGIRCATGTWVSAIACDPRRPLIAAAAGLTLAVAALDDGAFSRDGSSSAGSVCVLGPLTRAIDCVAFLPDGTLCSCGYGGVTLFRELPQTDGRAPLLRFEAVPRFAKTYHSGAAGTTLGYKGWLLTLAPSPTGEWIASGCSDNTVRLWKVRTGQDFKCGGYSSKISSVVWSPNGELCATSGSNQATLWGFAPGPGAGGGAGGGPAGTVPFACVGQKVGVSALAFQPRGRLFASGSVDGTVQLYDTACYEPGDLRQGRPHLCHALCSFGTAQTVGPAARSIEHLAWTASGVLIVACGLGKCTALRVG